MTSDEAYEFITDKSVIESKTILPRMHRKEGTPSGACVIEATRTNIVI